MVPEIDPFHPDNFRLPPGATPLKSAQPKHPPRHRRGQWFLRGPVPWPWLEIAARLPGRAPIVAALCLWREAGRLGCRTVRLCLSRAGLGLKHRSARRALQSLEKAGLVAVIREPGRAVEVTLLDAPRDEKT
jgi:hypothetical protein